MNGVDTIIANVHTISGESSALVGGKKQLCWVSGRVRYIRVILLFSGCVQ